MGFVKFGKACKPSCSLICSHVSGTLHCLHAPQLSFGCCLQSGVLHTSTCSLHIYDVSTDLRSSLLQLYMGERPWAGLRPVQIILKKSQGKARLTWPDGAPEQYRVLSERCQTTDYKQRPTFTEVRRGYFPCRPLDTLTTARAVMSAPVCCRAYRDHPRFPALG